MKHSLAPVMKVELGFDLAKNLSKYPSRMELELLEGFAFTSKLFGMRTFSSSGVPVSGSKSSDRLDRLFTFDDNCKLA